MKTNKQKTVEMDLLSAIERVVEAAEGSELKEEFYDEVREEARYISRKLGLTLRQSVMLALLVDKGSDCSVTLASLAEYLGCRTTRILRLSKEIDVLMERQLVRRGRYRDDKVHYSVPVDVVEALKENRRYRPRDISGLAPREFFDAIGKIFDQIIEDETERQMGVDQINRIIDANPQLGFVDKLKSLDLSENDMLLVTLFCHLFVDNNDDNVGFYEIEDLFDPPVMHNIRYELRNGDSDLFDKHIIEYHNENGLANNECFNLTIEAKRSLLGELHLHSLSPNRLYAGMIKSSDVKVRKLYFGDAVTRNVDELTALLNEEHYQAIRQRLQLQGFRCGFNCLFYGAPGTGKTETALQLARRTGRDIMQVNISELKSMWVGESEKNVKALFNTYRQRVKDSEITPILLFNEADAIIGKRWEGAEHAVDKMENSLQNIILQEMETLDGILIATTNLAQNLDKAFERRFLYKICFERPDTKARAAIWRELMPDLGEADSLMLAKRYPFSGGQIENIARRHAIDAILHGIDTPTAQNLARYCDEEHALNRTTQHIGYIPAA